MYVIASITISPAPFSRPREFPQEDVGKPPSASCASLWLVPHERYTQVAAVGRCPAITGEREVMFSPFRDDQGRPKAIANVTWEDLSQLSELEEGFALEFKQTFGPSVRRKIPKIVA